jgi:hypothetical protein
MVDEKIVSIDDELPIDSDLLFLKLAKVPEEFKREYVQGIAASIDELLLWKSIFTGNISVAKHIIDGLDSSHFERFKTIVLNLAFTDSKKSVSEILEATLGFENPSPESQKKAAALIDLIKSRNIDYDAFFREFIFTARQLFHLATAMFIIDKGKSFERSLLDHLSSLPPTEFDGIEELFEEKLKRQAVE